jgi:hypothetical protein
MIRRLKSQVALELPAKLRHVVHFPRPPFERWPVGGTGGDSWEEEDGYEQVRAGIPS